MVDRNEIAIGSVSRDALSGVLTAIHRAGFGNVTRVLDPARGEIGGQLRRAAVAAPRDFALTGEHRVAVVINAAARTAAAIELMRRAGADATWDAARLGAATPPTFDELAARSRARPAPPEVTVAD